MVSSTYQFEIQESVVAVAAAELADLQHCLAAAADETSAVADGSAEQQH